jgi:hypothetical protein
MSYPLALQSLVIEDDDNVKDTYQIIFDTISRDLGNFLPFRIAAPCYAFSYEQALRLLNGSKIFHVVILDLRLTEKQGLPEVQDQDLGLDLLERCINRESLSGSGSIGH